MYLVKIREPNKFFNIKNKPIRSPFEIIVSDHDLDRIKSMILSYGILDYSIEAVDEIEIKEFKQVIKNESKIVKPVEEPINIDISSIKVISNTKKPRTSRKKKVTNTTEKIEDDVTIIDEPTIEELESKTSPILEKLYKKYDV